NILEEIITILLLLLVANFFIMGFFGWTASALDLHIFYEYELEINPDRDYIFWGATNKIESYLEANDISNAIKTRIRIYYILIKMGRIFSILFCLLILALIISIMIWVSNEY
ncbi:MAG: hypothetical protein JWN78_2831, partial [Bacteroidota bacterium]|nr:hypothetical protein [Bacteroidota bacterium]